METIPNSPPRPDPGRPGARRPARQGGGRVLTTAAAILLAVATAGRAAAQEPDTARGERLFNQQCRSCHSLQQGSSTMAGPSLYGLFGSRAGTVRGYEFSEAMVHSGIVWDERSVADYLRDPKAKVPGTKMAFGGMRQKAQIADIVAYLKGATQ